MDNKEIKWNIRQARKSLQMSQGELADKMGISRQAYVKLETGNTAIINHHISEMSEATGFPEEMILFGLDRKEAGYDEIKERQKWQDRLAEVRKDGEKQIAELRNRLSLLEELHEQDAQLIDALTSYNRMLVVKVNAAQRAKEPARKRRK